MHEIHLEAYVDEDRTVRLQLPNEVAPGKHRITVVVDGEEPAETDTFRIRVFDLPGWPSDVTMRRQDLYGDDER